MGYQIPFTRDTFRPTTIPGNPTAPDAVEFDLSMVGTDDLARAKTLLFACDALATTHWGPELESRVIAAVSQGGPLFVHGIDAVRNLTVPRRLAERVGLLVKNDGVVTDPDGAYAITTGREFAAIAPFTFLLAIEVAKHLTVVSGNAMAMDGRFLGPRTTSPASPAPPSGTAAGAAPTSSEAGTVA